MKLSYLPCGGKENLQFSFVIQSEVGQKGESYWYSATASVVTRIVENIEVIFPPTNIILIDELVVI